MKLQDKVIVVTGGANGIGRALCRRFAAESPRAIVVADLDATGAALVAQEIGGISVPTNVAIGDEVERLVQRVLSTFGQVDLFCSNAGIAIDGGPEAPD